MFGHKAVVDELGEERDWQEWFEDLQKRNRLEGRYRWSVALLVLMFFGLSFLIVEYAKFANWLVISLFFACHALTIAFVIAASWPIPKFICKFFIGPERTAPEPTADSNPWGSSSAVD